MSITPVDLELIVSKFALETVPQDQHAASRVVEFAQGALFGRILVAQWALRGRSSAKRSLFPGRFDGRSE